MWHASWSAFYGNSFLIQISEPDDIYIYAYYIYVYIYMYIVQAYLKILNLWNACQIYFVVCVSKFEHILSVIHSTIYGAVCF